MAFNCKETPTLLSFDSILNEVKKFSSHVELAENTVWYFAEEVGLAVMTHPAYGMVFYSNELQIEGLCGMASECDTVDDVLGMYGLERDYPVWREIGIDQVDFNFVS